MDKKYDLAIIGGGPGGYVAAIRAAQLKKRVVLIEKDRIGGTCMNYGCIPAKYLLHQTKIYRELKENKNIEGPLEKIKCNWKRVQEEKNKIVERLVKGIEFLLRKNGIEIVKGEGFIKSEKQIAVKTEGGDQILESDKIILATGSRPAALPFLEPNGKEVVTSREALEFDSIPTKMLVVGAGAVGIEMGSIYQRLGSDVSVLEIMPTILPGSDREMVVRLERILKQQGLKIHNQMRIEESNIKEGRVSLKGTDLKTQSAFEFEAEKVLLAAGRKPNTEGLTGKDLKLLLDKQGFVKVNNLLETSIPGIYAIGDMIGGFLLAHKASHEGIIAAENASGLKAEMNYKALPLAVYTEPEFSSVGLTEEEAKERGIKIQVGLFSLQANGRALTTGSQEGMVKIIADEKDEIIGAHILAANASEFISEISLAMKRGLKIQDVSSSIHIHPTLSEAVMEAALKAKNQAIHILNI
ncbi:MAG: dihydrolipoyl dehydrogenase [Candidatus Aminicenantes bacterium]|nr:MAG: dihydrolipoyl dehydrogenase [Candidatus Aminicenantes bacterium]